MDEIMIRIIYEEPKKEGASKPMLKFKFYVNNSLRFFHTLAGFKKQSKH